MRSAGRVTIYTVADRAGVSISTVSLALNAPHRVSAATRERVVAAATQLGYHSGGGRRARGSTLRVAVAAPFTTYPTYFRRLSGMLRREPRGAIDLMTHDLPSAASAASPLLDSLPARDDVDGLILMGVPLGGAALRASAQARLPVVLVDVRRAAPAFDRIPTVLIDDEAGGAAIAAHLRERGHRRAVFLHDPQRSFDYVSAGMLRHEGLRSALDIVPVEAASGEHIAPALRAALIADPTITAVVAGHDAMAAKAWEALRGMGRRVPDDVAVVGYDDGDLASALGLTTVRQPLEESGRTAVNLLLDAVAEGSRANRVVLMPELIVRASS